MFLGDKSPKSTDTKRLRSSDSKAKEVQNVGQSEGSKQIEKSKWYKYLVHFTEEEAPKTSILLEEQTRQENELGN